MGVPITREGYEILRKELEHLRSVERPRNIKAIEEARCKLNDIIRDYREAGGKLGQKQSEWVDRLQSENDLKEIEKAVDFFAGRLEAKTKKTIIENGKPTQKSLEGV